MEEEILSRYKAMQQAMVDKNAEALNEIILDGTTFRHMSGKVQTKEEYIHDIEIGALDYKAYNIENVSVSLHDDEA